MNSLNAISAPVQSDMDTFNRHFGDHLTTDSPLLNRIIRYVVSRKGKQMRPLMVFLSARLNGGVTSTTHITATLIELLHTATLVHDDVVDQSDLRRGFFSVNALWKNKAAVLVGDFLLARGLSISIEHNTHDMLRIVTEAVTEMSEGELLQIEKARFLNLSEDDYLTIIRKKTASLMAACCACGAQSAGAGAEEVKRMRAFGELAGMAFQIKDDLLDFQPGNGAGKPAGLDLQEGKMTLPVIHLLRQSSLTERRRILRVIKSRPRELPALMEQVRNSEGIAYATARMQAFRDEAIGLLHQFPANDARSSLEELVVFTTERGF